MGAETSIQSLNSSKSQSSPVSRGKLNFSGIKDYSKTQFFSCLCTQSDPNLSKERSSVCSTKEKPRSVTRRHSSTIMAPLPNPDTTGGVSETTQIISANSAFKLISTTVHHSKAMIKPVQSQRFQLKSLSISDSSSLVSSRESKNESNSEFEASESYSISESRSFKELKKSLQVSSSLLYDIDDLDEDFQSSLTKDTVLNREGDRMYKGESASGVPHGYGIEVWPDGSRYEGIYVNGVREGQGIYTWPDQRSYKGSFKANSMAGFGIFEWPNGNKYEGMWKDSEMHGEGKYTWNNGNSYTGGYCQGLKHGDGVFQYSNGKCIKAKWTRGCIQLNV